MLEETQILRGIQFPLSLLSGPINTSTQPPYELTYQFETFSQPPDLELSFTGWTSLTTLEKEQVRIELDHIETVLNVRFTEVSGMTDPDINIGKVDILGPTIGYGGYYYSAWSNGSIASYDGFAVYDNTLDLSSGRMWLILHELGHALGLKHSFEAHTEGSVTNPPLPSEYDNKKYTVMSYTENPETDIDSGGLALFDIFALQDIWGANPNHNTGDDKYSGPRLPGVDVIWDAGGMDWLDASVYSTDVELSLVPGMFSRFGSYEDVVIAFGVQIENATGGTGNDILIGSDWANQMNGGAGNDTLSGREGNDSLDGGDGEDLAMYSGGQASYTLTLSPTGATVTNRRPGGDGSDDLVDIELLDFDTELPLFGGNPMDLRVFGGPATLDPGDLESFIEMYIAYFNRAPDAIGLFFWGTAFRNGTTLDEMAALFIDQDETRAVYPEGTSNTDFATAVYNNVLGRIPDQAGFDFWVGLLNDETVGRDAFILEVLRGAKADPPPGASQEFIDQQLADQVYLAAKTDIGAYFAVHKGMSDVGNAMAAMALFDGTQTGLESAVSAIDGYHADALDPTDGEFLMPLIGVLDDPFMV